jgi:hypothetical protein
MIPSSSQVLIIGASSGALILGVALAKSGIEVLIVDENRHLEVSDNALAVEDDEAGFFRYIGFELTPQQNINHRQIEKQALVLLANSLCRILWNTESKVPPSLAGRFTIELATGKDKVNHQTSLIIKKEDLITGYSFAADLKNVVLLFWKVQGYITGVLSAKTLNAHKSEKDILLNYYSGDAISKSFLHKIFDRMVKPVNRDFNLRESKINLHLSQFRDIVAGDLLPDLKVYDEKKKAETSFYEWCRFGEFSLIMIGDLPSYNLLNYAKWIKSNFNINLFYLPSTEKNASIFEFFSIYEGEKRTLIVRPDRYIGLINDRIELEIIYNYLSNVLFMHPILKAFSPKEITDGSIENYP